MKKIDSTILFSVATLLTSVLITSTVQARARGGEGVGGGDQCENRIKLIRTDLRQWLQTEEPKSLHFENGLKAEDYTAAMTKEIDSAKIRCVGPGDEGYPVVVDGVPKTCRFEKSPHRSTITCDSSKMLALNEEAQYGQTHHEYAGLAGFENPDGADSNYDLSNQISYSLETVSVKKLGRVKALPMAAFKEMLSNEAVLVGSRLLDNLRETRFQNCTFEMVGPRPDEPSRQQVILSRTATPQKTFNYFPARFSLMANHPFGGDHLYLKAGPSPIVRSFNERGFLSWTKNGELGNFEAIYYYDVSGTKILKATFEQTIDVSFPTGSIDNPKTATRRETLAKFECHAI